MKKYITLITYSILCLLISGCFSDKSGLDTNKIDQVSIETPTMPQILRLEYLEDVTFTPTIKVGNETNPAYLSYKWELNQTPGSTDMVVIGTNRELKTTVVNQILSTSYTLIFTVKDSRYGIEYQKSWPLFVSSSLREGIAVASTRDGISSDISLIMDNSITTSYDKGAVIKYDLWKATTGSSHPALIKSITYTLHKPSAIQTKNIIAAIFENKDIRMYDCQNYSLYKTADQIFPTRNSTFDPQAFYTINNGYWLLVSANKVYAFPSNQGITSFMLPVSGENYINKALMVADNTSGAGPFAFWYNNNTGKFYNVSMPYATPAGGGEYTVQGSFNPQNVPSREIIATDISVDGVTPSFLMKNTTTGNYEIYTISFGYYDANWNSVPSAPKFKADLPQELNNIIGESVSIFFSTYDPIMYVVTASKIYAVTFGGGIVGFSEKYIVPSGEQIVKAKLFMQGRYRLNRKDFDTVNGPIFEPELPLNTKAIVIATKKADYEGQIYLLPLGTPGTGNINSAAAKKYEGFGKILDFTFQGQ